MQNTLPITPGNPLRNVTGLARQISLPGEHAPLRFPSFPALERTAVMGFNQPASLAVSAGVNTAITVFRQATYPVWADQSLQYAWAVDYAFGPLPATSGLASQVEALSYPLRPALQGWATSSRSAISGALLVGLNGFPSSSSGQPAYPPLGSDANLPGPEWVYVPHNSMMSIVVTAPALTTYGYTVEVNIERWRSPGQAQLFGDWYVTVAAGVTGGAQPAMATVIEGFWARPLSCTVQNGAAQVMPTQLAVSILVQSGGGVTYTPSPSTGGLLAFNTSTVVSHMPLVGPVEFQNSSLPWYATRVTAAALLCTNVTQVLNKGGTVLGGRVSPAVVDAWSVSYNYINGLHPAEKAYLPLETGLYTYCPPSTDLVFFGDYTINTAFAPSAPVFLLSNDAMYNKVFLQAPVASTMACTVTWHIEFRTSSALFQIGLSGMTLEALHQAQLVLAESGFFFENVEHERLLGRVVAAAKKYAPTIAGVINPAAGRLLQSVVSQLGNGKKTVKVKSGPSKPATTSAKASGITASAKPGKARGGKKPPGKGKRK